MVCGWCGACGKGGQHVCTKRCKRPQPLQQARRRAWPMPGAVAAQGHCTPQAAALGRAPRSECMASMHACTRAPLLPQPRLILFQHGRHGRPDLLRRDLRWARDAHEAWAWTHARHARHTSGVRMWLVPPPLAPRLLPLKPSPRAARPPTAPPACCAHTQTHGPVSVCTDTTLGLQARRTARHGARGHAAPHHDAHARGLLQRLGIQRRAADLFQQLKRAVKLVVGLRVARVRARGPSVERPRPMRTPREQRRCCAQPACTAARSRHAAAP